MSLFTLLRIRDRIEEHPDDWYRMIHPRGYMRNLKLICKFVGAKPENTVLVENVTTGILFFMFMNL